MRHQSHGFSLIELMMAMVITAEVEMTTVGIILMYLQITEKLMTTRITVTNQT